MSLILDGTNGLSDVDGSAATPAIRGSDANTGVFFGADQVGIATNGVERVEFGNSETVFNDGGADVDFRVESDTDANALFVQGSDGNVGIGTSSPLGLLNVKGSNGQLVLNNGATSGGMRLSAFTNAGTANGFLAFEGYSSEYGRFDSSGNLLVGTTSRISGERLSVRNTGSTEAASFRNDTSTNATVIVRNDGASGTRNLTQYRVSTTDVGFVSSNGSTTTYNTSSDYRLKENIALMTGALEKVAALKPCTYVWKATGEADEGFIAHELAEVCQSAVTGEKDAVDADGKPVYQGIDTSFLVATLTAAIQEQQQIITALTARVEALEGAQA
jgi:hypothetical protein